MPACNLVSVLVVVASITASLAEEKFPDRLVSTDGRLVRWTLDSPTDARVEFLGAKPLSLELRCDLMTSLYDSKTRPKPNRTQTEFSFAYRNPPFKETATVHTTFRRYNLTLGPVTVQLTFDPDKGTTALFDKVPQEKAVPLVGASCSEQAENGVRVESNQLFILDLRQNFPKKVWTPSQTPELRRNSPSTVKCLQKSLGIDAKLQQSSEQFRQPAVPVTYEWFLCDGSTQAACEASKTPLRNVASFSEWPMQVRADGELYSPFVPENIVSNLQNKRLLCSVMNIPVAFYSAALSVVPSTAATVPLTMVRPVGSEKVFLYDSAAFALTLPCHFNASLGATASWSFKKGGEKVALKAGAKNNELKVSVSQASESITFQGPFSSKTEGVYSCTVTSDGKSVTGSYKVTYKGPPRRSADIPKTKYMVQGTNGRIRCRFQDEERIIPVINVAGKSIDFDSTESINQSRREVNEDMKNKILPINFTLNIVQPKKGSVLYYTEWNATYNSSLDSTHFVTCIGHQMPFTQRARVEFKTVPAPQFNVSASCGLRCDVTVDLVNLAVFQRDNVQMAYSYGFEKTEKECSLPKSTYGQSSISPWTTKENSGQGNILCVCVHLQDPNSKTDFFSACKSAKVSASPNYGLIIGIVFVVIVLVIVAVAVICIFYRRRNRAAENGTKDKIGMKGEGESPQEAPLLNDGNPKVSTA